MKWFHGDQVPTSLKEIFDENELSDDDDDDDYDDIKNGEGNEDDDSDISNEE